MSPCMLAALLPPASRVIEQLALVHEVMLQSVVPCLVQTRLQFVPLPQATFATFGPSTRTLQSVLA